VASILAFLYFLRPENKNKFSTKHLWVAYLYVMCLLSLVFAILGGSKILKHLTGTYISYEFSYQLVEDYYSSAINSSDSLDQRERERLKDDYEKFLSEHSVVEKNGRRYYKNNYEVRKDLIIGLSLFFPLILIFLVHYLLLKKQLRKKQTDFSMLSKLYNFISLLLYGICSTLFLPASIYRIMQYLLDTRVGNDPPGEFISLSVFTLPIWIYFIFKVSKKEE